MNVFSKRLKERREALNITQEEFASRINKNQKQVWQYEAGRTMPKADVVSEMAKHLDTTTDWLLGLTDNPNRPLRGENDLEPIEIELVGLLRSLSPNDRRKVLNAVKALV